MQFHSKLLQRRAAAPGAKLNKIYDVYMKPDGRVEGDGENIAETLSGNRHILVQRSIRDGRRAEV